MSEEELLVVLDAQHGDKQALAKLLRQNQDMIFRFCCSRLGDHTAAKDATQETACRVIDSISRYGRKAKLKTWLLGIANNVCREFCRAQSRWQHFLDEEINETRIFDNPASLMIEAENVAQLNHGISKLPERQREAVLLRYFESLQISEVAEVMEVSVGTVKATLHSAVGNLRSQFK